MCEYRLFDPHYGLIMSYKSEYFMCCRGEKLMCSMNVIELLLALLPRNAGNKHNNTLLSAKTVRQSGLYIIIFATRTNPPYIDPSIMSPQGHMVALQTRRLSETASVEVNKTAICVISRAKGYYFPLFLVGFRANGTLGEPRVMNIKKQIWGVEW